MSSLKNGADVHLKQHLSYLVLGLLVCIFVVFFTVCIMVFTISHILELKCHLQYQIQLVNLQLFHIFFFGTCPLWWLLQMAISCICICQIGIQML